MVPKTPSAYRAQLSQRAMNPAGFFTSASSHKHEIPLAFEKIPAPIRRFGMIEAERLFTDGVHDLPQQFANHSGDSLHIVDRCPADCNLFTHKDGFMDLSATSN
jgi:hypothetical protein